MEKINPHKQKSYFVKLNKFLIQDHILEFFTLKEKIIFTKINKQFNELIKNKETFIMYIEILKKVKTYGRLTYASIFYEWERFYGKFLTKDNISEIEKDSIIDVMTSNLAYNQDILRFYDDELYDEIFAYFLEHFRKNINLFEDYICELENNSEVLEDHIVHLLEQNLLQKLESRDYFVNTAFPDILYLIKQNKSINSIILDENTRLNPKFYEELYEILKKKKNLRYLQIPYYNVLETDGRLITKAFENFTALEGLVLYGKPNESQSQIRQVPIILPDPTKMRNFILIDIQLGYQEKKILHEEISKMKNLQILCLSGRKMNELEVRQVLKGLMNLDSLQCLNFSYNSVCLSGIKMLHEILQMNKGLISLYLQSIDIRDDECKEIASILFNESSHLETIVLCENNLSNIGIEGIVYNLKNWKGIIYLYEDRIDASIIEFICCYDKCYYINIGSKKFYSEYPLRELRRVLREGDIGKNEFFFYESDKILPKFFIYPNGQSKYLINSDNELECYDFSENLLDEDNSIQAVGLNDIVNYSYFYNGFDIPYCTNSHSVSEEESKEEEDEEDEELI